MGSEHTHLRDSIYRITGMKIEEDKIYLIETRLSEIMKEFGISSYDDLATRLEEGKDEVLIDRVIEKITTHETRFFRDESIFDALVMQIIPEWMERKGISRKNPGNARLDIWSAGCSTGQEAYSIAMMIREKIPELASNVTILGTDISKETLEKAKKGEYTRFEVERGLPEKILSKYFVETEKKTFRVSDDVRKNISFQYHNLTGDPIPGTFDIVFFRNVAIYFPEEPRKDLYQRVKSAVKNDGILVLGSAESLAGYVQDYIVREYGLARYYEVNASRVTLFK